MVLTLKNRKYKNKKTIKNNNLKGGKKNFIEYLFNLNDSDNEDEDVQNKKNDQETKCNTENKKTSKIENQIINSDNILKEWIKNTDEENGMTLYFAKQNKDESSKELNNKWIDGYHGIPLQDSSKIHFNEYVKLKLQESNEETDKKCLEKLNSSDCLKSLNNIQINDINLITNRIKINNKVNKYLFDWISSNQKDIQNQEKEIEIKIQEMKKKIQDRKDNMEKHIGNVKSLIEKNKNYNQTIRDYINENPNYNELREKDSKDFTIDNNFIKYIELAIEKDSSNSISDIKLD